ncbi:MAG TPA: hypothetical protein VF070_30950 [Streptosporangiaceae bacterium]
MPDVTFDSLEEEEFQDGDDSHAQIQRLLGSIHLQGIHPQVVRQAGKAEPLPDIAADSLEEEESQDGLGSHLRMQHLLGSIHLQGIRLQSPIYFEGSQRLRPENAASQEDDILRDDTVILVAVERLPRDGYPEADAGEEARPR